MKLLLLLCLLSSFDAVAPSNERHTKVHPDEIKEIVGDYKRCIGGSRGEAFFRDLVEKSFDEQMDILFGRIRPEVAEWIVEVFLGNLTSEDVEKVYQTLDREAFDDEVIVAVQNSPAFTDMVKNRQKNKEHYSKNANLVKNLPCGSLYGFYGELKDIFAPFAQIPRNVSDEVARVQRNVALREYPLQGIRTWVTRDPKELDTISVYLDGSDERDLHRLVDNIERALLWTGLDMQEGLDAILSAKRNATAHKAFANSLDESKLYRKIVHGLQKKKHGSYTFESFTNAVGNAVGYDTIKDLYDRVKDYESVLVSLKRDPRYSLLSTYEPHVFCGSATTTPRPASD